jgi:hypothetical protein
MKRSMSLMPMNGAMIPPTAVDEEVAPEDGGRALGDELDPSERQRDQRHDDRGR